MGLISRGFDLIKKCQRMGTHADAMQCFLFSAKALCGEQKQIKASMTFPQLVLFC